MSDLQSKVLVVKPTISMLGNTRTHKELTSEVHSRHNTADDTGQYVIKLIKPEHLKAINGIVGEARRYHGNYSIRSSFGDLIPTALFERYEAKMKEFILRFNAEADRFSVCYDSILEEARLAHNGTFKAELYPPRHAIRDQFRFTLFHAPMPRGNDVAVDFITDQRLSDLRSELDARVVEAGRLASKQVVERVLEQVRNIADRLSDPDAVFRDSLITNLRSVLDIAPALNIASDPTTTALVEHCRRQLDIAPQLIRDHSAVRSNTARVAADVLARFGNIGARKLAA